MRNRMGLLFIVTVTLLLPQRSLSQPPTPVTMTTVFASQAADAASWDARLLAMEAGQELQRLAVQADSLAPEWIHERFQQRYRGLEIFGAQMIRHWRNGRVAAVNGKFYPRIGLNTTPAVGPEQTRLVSEGAAGAGARAVSEPELIIYPQGDRFALAYRLHVRTRQDLILFLIDATTGAVLDSWSDRRTQTPAVGEGHGTWEDIKKMSTTQENAEYIARDGHRPAVAWTVDVQGDFDSWNRYQLDPENDAARDSDNEWQDGAVVDAHVYAGWTYDYYFKRFGRRGLNDANRAVTSYIHFWPRYLGPSPWSDNAFWDPTDKSVNYGDGDGGIFNYFSSALDVVAHELTHGVTQFTSDLVYRDESGALNEAFSDIMATGAEFFFEPLGFGRQHSDWAAGEDLFMRNFQAGNWFFIRYYPDPRALDDPDHYRIRYTGQEDNGGVHTNSLIASHAFYLFVEGGTNRTSGMSVDGIGFANIAQAEKIFYRAFTNYLVPTSNFSDARQATLQSARDLYGTGGREEQELQRAWNAVGVQ